MTPTTTKKRAVRPSFLPLADRADHGKRHLLPRDHWQSNRGHFGMIPVKHTLKTHFKDGENQTLRHKVVHRRAGNLNSRPGAWTQEFCAPALKYQLPLTSMKEYHKKSNGWPWASEHSLKTIHFCVYLCKPQEEGNFIPHLTEDCVIKEAMSQEPKKIGINLAYVSFPTKSYLDMLSPPSIYIFMMVQSHL